MYDSVMEDVKLQWRPTASCDALIARAELLKKVRAFFDERGVIEVETPLLSHATITDPYIEAFPVKVAGEMGYLQTSPEYAMKRLLSAGMPSIYQMSKVFRVDEAARYHNPEFTLLEWYRLDFDLFTLMDDVDALFQLITGCAAAKRVTYQEAFAPLGIDPLTVSKKDCQALAQARGLQVSASVHDASRDTWLQLLFSTYIEPDLGFDAPVFVYDFPASQAMLSRLHPDDPRLAYRVEVFMNGMELGNGYDELQDPTVQQLRFEEDNRLRAELGLAQKPIDPYLLAALPHFPRCSGIAIGIDRLFMCALKKSTIDQVLCFPWPRA